MAVENLVVNRTEAIGSSWNSLQQIREQESAAACREAPLRAGIRR